MGHHGRVHARNEVDPGPEPAAPAGGGLYPRTTSFRSRRSALSEAQRRLWERRWAQLGTEVPADGGAGPLDLTAWFGRCAPRVLEIGCGTGSATVAMAQAEPDVDVLAVEVYRRGLAQLLSGIDRAGLANIRLLRGDAVTVLHALLAPDSLTGVRVFFPDPWPKARHHKRRLLQPDVVALIAERLRPGGVLHVATDHAGYAEQIGAVGDAETRLRRVEPGRGLPISVRRPATKYEGKARDADRAVTELIWEKRQS
ncbi:tRNA (guanosine(46)-N7)-methyltransferase TrmB [Mycolicibacillus parakoreensis]|uniref:tRNA (guanine-N(7)-)-methyltransferase n=1 Tax=Mycolicibacillus parakoreensis TaxID=1069221 RepID=A0ABY3U6J9_9MYCO|nr:tRNA (guanosine(46)-N7)-methyltransferase TrmB [Mycolicibacillus parakoreensis]MCV7316420.1 tRNA (guanosine(46)-N7)-methyltransferase TrmB [Mycolicibacillus parakoreensis]ULN54740.1 tRNA (guanosine(46)-N7)-methyltransferase TrmB [Mycolicibacillus parakoreensis]